MPHFGQDIEGQTQSCDTDEHVKLVLLLWRITDNI